MTTGPPVTGFALVDKSAGVTSHDVVARARRVLGQRRIGHAGTLDPDATGLLVLGIGRATRLLRFVTGLAKTYEGEIVLGVETDTLDAAGSVVARHDMGTMTLEDVRRAAASFEGEIRQVPPMVSAVRVDGRRLHELARAGVEVEREARPVTVHEIAVEPVGAPDVYRLHVTCSSGTYVRSLAADIGAALGGGAHLRALRRTRVGSLSVADAHPVDDLAVVPPAAGLADYGTVTVDDDLLRAVGHGRVLADDELGVSGDGPWAVCAGTGELVAVYERRGPARVKPAVVMATG